MKINTKIFTLKFKLKTIKPIYFKIKMLNGLIIIYIYHLSFFLTLNSTFILKY